MSSRFAMGVMIGAIFLVAPALEAQSPPMRVELRGDGANELKPHFLFEPQGALSTETQSTNRKNYAGDEACRACHSDKLESYLHTPHHLSSRLPSKDSILGPFAEGKNILKTVNPELHFRMESKPDGFYQSSVWALPSATAPRTEKIAIVIGSGRVGQTYLYWKGDRLFQLPVSYWAGLEGWVNSPGYRDGTANFERPVVPRCLECHMAYAESVDGPAPPNHYKPSSLVMGVSCERCHGPGGEHAGASTTNKAAGGIVNPTKLTRERQLELCSQCHGGIRIPVMAVFSYVPGEPLDKYYRQDPADPGATVDVHGNQVALLQKSRCFQSSAGMSCSTCHDVHQTQREAAAFSTHCLQCHQMETCGEFPKLGRKIAERCVDCHMPVQPSKLIITNSNGQQTRAMKRNHWIKIYPETRAP
jgi:hypothetical protein